MRSAKHVIALLVAVVGCGGATEGPAREDPSAQDESTRESAPEDVAGVEKGWETDCEWLTCWTSDRRFVSCADPNDVTHYHYGGLSCGCESPSRQCGECDRNAPCLCANDVREWCQKP